MDTFKIQCFCTLAKLKNFTATGEALHISQPAVSKNIQTLEQEFGITLLIRNSRSIDLTPAGEYMLAWFTEASADFDRRLKQAKLIQQETTNILNMGILIGSKRPEVTTAIQAFRARYPDVWFSINSLSYNEIRSNLLGGTFDILLSTDMEHIERLSGVNAECLCGIDQYFVYSSHSPLSDRPDLTPADFRNETFLISSGPDEDYDRQRLMNICTHYGFLPRINACTLSIEAAFGMVEAGMGVICSDSNQLGNYAVTQHSRQALHLCRLDIPVHYCAIWPKNGDVRIEQLMVLLKDAFAK